MIDGVVDAEEALVGVSEKPLFFCIRFSKSFVFLQQKKPGAQALTSCINGCGVANRQVEQAASGVCGHPPFFLFLFPYQIVFFKELLS